MKPRDPQMRGGVTPLVTEGASAGPAGINADLPAALSYLKVEIPSNSDVLVVTFDIRSSTRFVEKLTSRGDMRAYDLLIKHFLAAHQGTLVFDPYKFTGDGWILLFPVEAMQGRRDRLLRFIRDLSEFSREQFAYLNGRLDSPVTPVGLTFGVDRGHVTRHTVFDVREFIGRAIVVACRLQQAAKTGEDCPAYGALVTRSVYHDFFAPATGCSVEEVSRTLRNISDGEDFRCMQIDLLG
jgi:class 3 adenylate cyclase